MTKNSALFISGDKGDIKITSLDGTCVYFEAGEEQASRVSSYVGTVVGRGDVYAYYEGEYIEDNAGKRFVAEGAAGLGTLVEIVLSDKVEKLSISWMD